MPIHEITGLYLDRVARKANQTPQSLKPEDTWIGLGVADEDVMRRLAGALQNVAARYNSSARIPPGQVSGARDVAGGLIVTWRAAALGDLTRDQAIQQIRDAQRGDLVEVVVTASTKRKSKSVKKRKSTRKRKSPKKRAKTSRTKPRSKK